MPKSILYAIECGLRGIYHRLFYSGDRVHCNVCDNTSWKFKELDNGNLLCTYCGSLPRQRRLADLLNNNVADDQSVLHLSPARCLNRKYRKLDKWKYVTSDYAPGYLIDEVYDLTETPVRTNKYDAIICYHVLEHIAKDDLAIKHLHQLLKPGGQVFIQTPFKDGDIYEDFSIESEADRLKHFGQADHVRIYSVQGLRQRLESSNFHVDILTFEENIDSDRCGLEIGETVLIAKKT